MRLSKPLIVTYWSVTIAAFAGVLALAMFYAPVEASMGSVQKIFYLHLPVAINAFVACFVVFIASAGYLWQRKLWWDDLAEAGGKVAVLFCAVVLITGMIWARGAWGHWWTWSPRLTLTLVLFLLYAVYLMLRPAFESRQRAAVVCAVYGIAAFLDVPLVYLSVRLLDDIHPTNIVLEPSMQITLAAWFVPVTMLCFGFIVARFRINRKVRELEDSHAVSAVASLAHP